MCKQTVIYVSKRLINCKSYNSTPWEIHIILRLTFTSSNLRGYPHFYNNSKISYFHRLLYFMCTLIQVANKSQITEITYWDKRSMDLVLLSRPVGVQPLSCITPVVNLNILVEYIFNLQKHIYLYIYIFLQF